MKATDKMEAAYRLFEKAPTESAILFDAIRIRIASKEKIRSWSYGEVKKPETINYRSFKPERDGLFCARIFGPTKDWECNCGKYKRMKHRGIICDKCGVEVIQSKVRRERMGHINLAAPVTHIWFLKGVPSRIGTLLDMSVKQLERVLYFEAYIVVDPKETRLREKDVLTEEEYRSHVQTYGVHGFIAEMGAEAVREVLKRLDLDKLCEEVRHRLAEVTSIPVKKKLARRLSIIDAFRKSGNRPEWMVLDVIAVLPPDLRPLVPLDGGRFATSDLNDLYRRVINRNNRLKRLLELKAPSVIIRNEKRMLQEAVDVLFDNGRRGRAVRGTNKRPLKSLSDMLRGKQGRFRQNLLGKRVDYSGRSVIVVGPQLKLHQCGLPKKMALELFKPFVFQKLEAQGITTTIKGARKLVEQGVSEVWNALDEVVREHPVLLNRAPTLHRLGIQSFDPVLVEGKAIQLHPLVCASFNADFDGDQMAVHVPISIEAQLESRILMASVNNVLAPSNGKPVMVPSQDIVLGCYWLTKERASARGTGHVFSSPGEVRVAYDHGVVEEHARIKVHRDGGLVETTVGRVLFGEILPAGVPFSSVNRVLNKKELTKLVDGVYRKVGREEMVALLDRIKEVGYHYATKTGISICIDDMRIPVKKDALVKTARKDVTDIEKQYADGLITQGERYNKIVDIWAHTTETVADEMMKELAHEEGQIRAGTGAAGRLQFNSIFMMIDSGSRGSALQIRQLAGMRGLMAKPSGEIIETPITANFREGLTVAQYFISTHGARKGLADTALKTANAGYLTRRLVDIAQDITIYEHDCHSVDGLALSALVEEGEIIEPLEERILGRVAAEEIRDPVTRELICAIGVEIDEDKTRAIVDAGIDEVKIRSVLTCQSLRGVCALCYGRDLAMGRMVEKGLAVGVIAAQSIGEPGTQLTMRTFHIGGTASKTTTQTVLNARNTGTVKYLGLNTVRSKDGDITVMNRKGKIAIYDETGREKEKYSVIYGAKIKIDHDAVVEAGQKLVEWDPYSIFIMTEVKGVVALGDIIEGQTMREEVDETTGLSRRVVVDCPDTSLRPRISIKDESGKTSKSLSSSSVARYTLPAGAHILVRKGQTVYPGDVLAKVPRETTKTKDITGGLPRVAELFEARSPKEQAIISEIDGTVEYGGFIGGGRKVIVKNDTGESKEYFVLRGKHTNVHEGDWIQAGEPLMDGPVNPHDILNILGPQALQKYLVNEIQEVYRLQGVSINDKHIEVIVSKMLRWVRIEDSGDTNLLIGTHVDKLSFAAENQRVLETGGVPATGKPLLMGITKGALSTDSFISSASFQETTRVLTDAALSGKIDYFHGLKENVIVGRLIPAGTGLAEYRESYARVPRGSKLLAEKEVEENVA